MKTWASQLFSFYKKLQPPKNLPNAIEWLYPQQSEAVMEVVKCFLDKYYSDKEPRNLLFGINPGRFGAGVTGVNFTAARQLTEDCGVDHKFPSGSELSAEFIYAMINAYGGPEKFYRHYFIGSVSPLGFVKDGKNINYFDDKDLLQVVEPFIIENINQLLQANFNLDKCFCIGEDKNFRYLSKLNEQQGWFDEIVPLPHPRFIMQYKRKSLQQYIDRYLALLKK